MVADPNDLIKGARNDRHDPATATRAIRTYRERPQSGAAQLTRNQRPTVEVASERPFKAAGLRDPFNAFVCDDDTLELIRVAVGDMGWPIEKCNKGGLRNAVQSLSVSASPNILFVDMSESGDPINDINALAEVCEPGTVVIAAGQVNDVRLYRDLLSSGIQDYLLKPLSVDQVRESLTMAQAMLTAPKHADMHDDKPHHMMAVVGVRGGVGASLVSTSLAWAMSEQAGRQTALLDLDVHFGTGALTLDLEPGRGLIDAIDNPSRIDGLFIERAMVRASTSSACCRPKRRSTSR